MTISKSEMDKKNQHSDSFSNQLLFVSLYLVLLAFFILLNTINKQDALKTEDAINSINQSFSKKNPNKVNSLKLNRPLSLQERIDIFYRTLEKHARTTLRLTDLNILRNGNKMYIEIPLVDFFIPETIDIKDHIKPFLDGLSSQIKQELPGIRIEAELSISSEIYLANEPLKNDDIQILRVISLANFMFNKGVKEKNILVGITPSKERKLLITLNLREVNQSKLDLNYYE